MHVVYVLGQYERPSEGFVARELAALSELGVRVTVFSLQKPLANGVGAADGMRVVRCSAARVVRGLLRSPLRSVAMEARALWWSLVYRSLEPYLGYLGALGLRGSEAQLGGLPQVVHGGFAGLPAMVAMTYSEMSGQPFSFAGHARDVLVRPVLLGRKLARAAAAVACTQFIGDALRKHARRRCDADKVMECRHGLPRALMRRLAGIPAGRRRQGSPRILAAGRLVPKKGFHYLVDAVRELVRSGVSVHCTIAGDGPEREVLRSAIRSAGLDEVIALPGWVAEQDMISLYGESDVFVHPAVVAGDGDQDGLPNALLEAASAGLPIVTTDVGGIGEFVRHEESGILVEPANPHRLARAIERLLNDGELRARLAANAAREVAARFCVESNVRDMAIRLGWLGERMDVGDAAGSESSPESGPAGAG